MGTEIFFSRDRNFLLFSWTEIIIINIIIFGRWGRKFSFLWTEIIVINIIIIWGVTKQEYKDIYDIVGAAQEVHKSLGRGLSELIYQEALEMEMKLRGLDAEREKALNIYYKGQLMKKTYYADFCYHGVLVELKAVDRIISDHRSQLFNYMRISNSHRGVLLNFCERSLRAERYLFLPPTDRFVLLTQENYKGYIKD